MSSASLKQEHLLVVVLFFASTILADVISPCQFPPDLRGRWVRSRDKRTLIFTDHTVMGLVVRYLNQVMNKFKCHSLYENLWIIYDTHHARPLKIFNFYICWQLIPVSPHAFILYELTKKWNQDTYGWERHGYVMDAYRPINISQICSINPTDVLFTTLYRYNAPLQDISSMCPEALLGTFSYNSCKVAELDFCSDRKTAVANYKICPLQFLKSESGTVKCMGYVTRGTYLFLNMYSDGNVFCTKVPQVRELDGSIMMTVFNFDCSYVFVNATSTKNGSTTYALVEKTSCPPIVKPLQLKDISNIVMLIIGACMGTALLLNCICYCKYRKRRDSETPEDLSASSSQETPTNSPKKAGSSSSARTEMSTKSQSPSPKVPKTTKSISKGPTTLFTKYKPSDVDSSAYSVTL